MKIQFLESVDSTQTHLKNLLKNRQVSSPYAVVSKIQTDGLGSRDNSWIGYEGNLFLSFSINLQDLPNDLKLESASIYFAYILKETLSELGSKVWLKWPNDFYLDDLKIGGMITTVVDTNLICGVGLNLVKDPDGFGKIDISISIVELLNNYFTNIKRNDLWKQVFSKYKLEFYLNQKFFTHKNNLRISLDEAVLQSDGSIISNNERIYSLR